MIEAKIIIEIPLPIPCSVINSPSHIKMMEPAVIAVMASTHCEVDISMVDAVLAKADSFRIKMYAKDWTIARGMVIILVH